MLTNNIILVITKLDTLRPLGICFRPFANNECDTKHHKQCSGMDNFNVKTLVLGANKPIQINSPSPTTLCVKPC
jgi:hypothetical protein